ncbi:MAG: inorganic phosphate transporter [Halanaerobiaceae bacterium]
MEVTMDPTILFLSSGLFLGWSLGANDSANVFGTAVGTRMIKFKNAALIVGIFVIIGAVVSGAGASHTLGSLGAIETLPGAFTVALAAGLSVFLMTKSGLPVSTSQAIVGSIIGWNIFSGLKTDPALLSKFVGTWILCPLLAAGFAAVLYKITKFIILRRKIHLLRLDHYNRLGLIIVGAFGAYSLGANNIANVMGVFTRAVSLPSLEIGIVSLNSTQQLFFLGGLAIAVGAFTYSKKVMMTVGKDIFKISPLSAFVVVLSHSLVLFLFASEGLKNFLTSYGLPSLPLIPVSSSQAIVGGIIGIGLVKGARNIKYRVLGNIVMSWILTPIIAAIISNIGLFIMQNVFLRLVV